MKRLVAISFSLGMALLLAGCEAKIYRAETVLNADGSLNRSIYQPADETPTAAQEAGNWTTTTRAARTRHEDWQQPIASLPAAAADKKRPYFAAWGSFPSTDKLPQTFLVAGPQGHGNGTLEVELSEDDFVLVKELRWNETLTDIVTLDDMHRARQELADLLVPLAEKFLNHALGEEYDTRGVVDWLHTSVTPLAFDLTDVIFETAAREDFRAFKLSDYAQVLGRHGVKLRDDAAGIADSDPWEAAIRDYVREGLKQHLRRHDGQPVPETLVQELLQWVGLEPAPEGAERPIRFDAASQAALRETFGNDEAASQALKPLAQRIFGVYLFSLGSSRKFDYTLEMPGPVVETTGELLGDRKVRWRFSDGDAYPFGYRMECRALVESTALIEKLTGKAAWNRERMNRYIELVRDNAPLLAMMRISADKESLEPLRRERDALREAEDQNADRYTALLEFLDASGS